MKVAITGSNGQLGSYLCQYFGRNAVSLKRPHFDLARADVMESSLRAVRPDVVLNTAAYTQVDNAETHAEECSRVNGEAVGALARVCRELDCVLMQISTDYVFGEERHPPALWSEQDPTSPRCVYARTKHAGELLAADWERHFIVRTCGLYCPSPDGPVRGRNFVDTMLTLSHDRHHVRVVNDQFCTPTYIPHLARALEFLLGTQAYGTYHVTNSGCTNWCEFASELFRRAAIDMEVEAISSESYGAAAPRPPYSCLSLAKYQQLGGPPMPSWQDGLRDYLSASLPPRTNRD